MALDIDQEIAALRQLTVPELRARHQELFGEPSRSAHKQHLVRRIAWRLQALAEGDLTERARRRAAALARDADLRIRAPRGDVRSDQTASPANSPPTRDGRLPAPGTLLVRSYQGRTLQVKVLEQGFEYEGQISGSLTAVARQITGQHWNGYHFFGLTEAPT
jgi:hypothetical protein